MRIPASRAGLTRIRFESSRRRLQGIYKLLSASRRTDVHMYPDVTGIAERMGGSVQDEKRPWKNINTSMTYEWALRVVIAKNAYGIERKTFL